MEERTRGKEKIEKKKKKNFEYKIKFLSESYVNIQSCLRFFDAKAAAALTVNAFWLKIVFEEFYKTTYAKSSVHYIFLLVAIFFSLISVVFSLLAVWPSHPPKEKSKFSLLFPSLHPSTISKLNKNKEYLCDIALKKAKKITFKKIEKSYSCQLGHLGVSLAKKIRYLKASLLFFILSIITGFIFMIIKDIM